MSMDGSERSLEQVEAWPVVCVVCLIGLFTGSSKCCVVCQKALAGIAQLFHEYGGLREKFFVGCRSVVTKRVR